MSVKVPTQTVEYQSHNHCQCDFCSSRRSNNAKKLAISQRAAELQHAKDRNGCCCQCHDTVNARTFAASRNANTTFDPEYPAPVNQTALNASRGRVGAQSRSGVSNGATATVPKTRDEEAKDAAAELDQLERLLVIEHKARVTAALEADRLGTLRGGTTSLSRGPQPLPADYVASTRGASTGFDGSSAQQRLDDEDVYGGGGLETIRDAYDSACACPVTPPAQCGASHRLQHTMNSVRAVTMDPVNPAGRERLQQVLYASGMGDAPASTAAAQSFSPNGTATSATSNEFGGSLAKNRTSHSHPQGAGLVWVNGAKKSPSGTTNAAEGTQPLSRTAATAEGVAPLADGSAKASKKVTYAV